MNLVDEKHKILNTKLPEVDLATVDKEAIKQTATDMLAFMKKNRGIGLAANQVGLNLRMFVMGNDFANFTCINPVILEASEETIVLTEGCLSYPNLILPVKRSRSIKVRYYDEDLKEVECTFDGKFGQCFQHELEHLDGITFISKVSKLRLKMATDKRLKKDRKIKRLLKQ